MAMGIAELVPGVSGGTIAFVTGIYTELVSTLASFRLASVSLLLRDGVVGFWRHHNLSFLLALGLGMVVSVLLFARLFHYLLEHMPTVVWSFFFGLIAASVVQIGRLRSARHLLGAGMIGLLGGLLLLFVNPGDGGAAPWVYFFAGMAAVSAWLLPAVSGSFLLLAMGLYGGVLEALSEGDWPVLLMLGAGCVVGLLAFARILAWVMDAWREPVLALLTGFMAGSLVRLWPWRLDGAILGPAGFEAAAGQPALLGGVVLAGLAGVTVLWLLSRLE
jgi:putative membrane protein